jgi:dolichol-phosphate mannosyltransferase
VGIKTISGPHREGSQSVKGYLRSLISPAGENLFLLGRACFGFSGFLVILTDLGLFLLLLSAGIPRGTTHILSYFPSTVIFYFLVVQTTLRKKGIEDPSGPGWRQTVYFSVIAVMCLFLRGGVIATLTEAFGSPSSVAILPAIVVSWGINCLGCAFFVLPVFEKDHPNDLRWQVLSVGMIGYAFLLRLSYMGAAPLLPQEAYYWNYAQHLDMGYLDHPPMVAWAIWLGTHLLGDTEMGVRLGAFAAWIVTAYLGVRFARNLFDFSTALRTLLLLSVLPFFFAMGLVVTPDSFLVACWAGILYFLERSLLGGQRHAWWGVGVCAGLGLLSKYTIGLLAPAVLLFLLLDRRSRSGLRTLEPYGAAFLAFLIFLPVIIWNAEHQWASFVFQGARRFRDTLSFTFPELLGSVLILLTPTGGLAAFVALYFKTETKREEIDGAFGWRKNLFVSLFTLFPFLFFAGFSLARTAKLNWTGPLWLAVIPLMARQMDPHNSGGLRRLLKLVRRGWIPTLLGSLLLYGLALHFWVLGIPGVPYPKSGEASLLISWRELAQEIDRIDHEVQVSKAVKPLVVGMDKCYIASEIIFYRNQQQGGKNKKELMSFTTGRHLFGMDSLMYRFWFPESRISEFRKENSILILVTRELHELNSDRISSHGWKMGEVQPLVLKKNGNPVGLYYYALAQPK